jgi:hypothetical protein
MTVEQRIFYENSPPGQTIIMPGDKSEISVIAVDSLHPHNSYPLFIQAECAQDDSHGTVRYNHPEAGFIEKDFSGESKPFYLIKMNDELGLIEWEHKPQK